MAETNLLAKLKQQKVYILLVVFVLLYIWLNVWIFFYGTGIFGKNVGSVVSTISLVRQPTIPSPVPASPTPTLRPIKEIPDGKQVYRMRRGNTVKGPAPNEIIVDPQTPGPSETQTVIVKLASDSPITEASVVVHTDNTTLTTPLNLIVGTDTDGTWQTSYKITDTYNYTYLILFDVKSATGEYASGLTLRQ